MREKSYNDNYNSPNVRKGITISCEVCSKPVWVQQHRIGRTKFCSKSCFYQGRKCTNLFEKGHKDYVPNEARLRAAKCISIALTGRKLSEETRKKLSTALTGRKLTKEHIKKSLTRRPMSSLERKLNDIIIKNNLPYQFVGNGKFFIGRKNPDFIHKKNKIVIEVFYRAHKEKFAGGLQNWIRDRKEAFMKEGWETIFLDETQVTEEYMKLYERGADYC